MLLRVVVLAQAVPPSPRLRLQLEAPLRPQALEVLVGRRPGAPTGTEPDGPVPAPEPRHGEAQGRVRRRAQGVVHGNELLARGGVAGVDLDLGAGAAGASALHAPKLLAGFFLPKVANLPVEAEAEGPRRFAKGDVVLVVVAVDVAADFTIDGSARVLFGVDAIAINTGG